MRLGRVRPPRLVSTAVVDGRVGAMRRADRLLSTVPAYPLLLSAYPVLRLYSDNIHEVPADSVLLPLLLTLAVAAVATFGLGRAWGEPRRAALVVAAVIVPFLTVGLIADAVSSVWPHEPVVRANLVAVLIWIAIALVTVYAALKIGRLGAPTQGLNLISITLVMLALVPVGGGVLGSIGSAADVRYEPNLASAAIVADVGEDADRRDVYHLVFDRYGSDAALRLGLGIDNSDFTRWLSGQGFHVIEGARANYERTALSLSSTHSMALLDELAARMGRTNPDLSPLYERIRNSAAASVLQSLGYRYYHVGSWFHPTTRSDIADYVGQPEFAVSFASTLVDQSGISALRSIIDMVTTLSAHGTPAQQAEVTRNQFHRLSEIRSERGPKYVFAHVLVPHDPYLFLEDGSFDPERATFATQLGYANDQIRGLVEPLLALPPEDQPIIILQADEGPYPIRYAGDRDAFDWASASDVELLTKFGVLSALYLPGPAGQAELPEHMTLVNTFPEIFERYFGIAVPRAPDRTFALGPGGPYDLIEITQEIDAAAERQSRSDARQAALSAEDLGLPLTSGIQGGQLVRQSDG